MSPQNRTLNTVLRIGAAVALLAIHFSTLKLWEAKEHSELSTYNCTTEGACHIVQTSLLDFYREASFWDWIWMHGCVALILILLALVFSGLGLVGFFILTGRLPFSDSAEDEDDDFTPCKNPQCNCVSHENEEFTTEWQPRD